MLQHIRFVLANPSHPGNIGSSARAMKTMGLQRLYLVEPKRFPHVEASYLSSGADDILENAIVTRTLDEAISNCTLVIGTSARLRKLPQPMLTPSIAAEKVLNEPSSSEIAFVFGNEQSGLNNDDLRRCHYHVCIPTIEAFSSLNLAAAVQVIAYELYHQFTHHFHLEPPQTFLQPNTRHQLATTEELEILFERTAKALAHLDILDPTQPRSLILRLRQIIQRARIDKDELNLIHGIMTAILKLN